MKTQHTPFPWEIAWKEGYQAVYIDGPEDKDKGFIALYGEVKQAIADAAFIVTAVNAHEIYETTLRRIAERDKGQTGFEARQALGIKDDEKDFQRWKKARAEGK